MRAGFHSHGVLSSIIVITILSQSLVNEGRFPQETVMFLFVFLIFLSQSLVNEGRFPPDILEQVSEGIYESQSLVNEGRFPQWKPSWILWINRTCRNPSLMRAGFHNYLMNFWARTNRGL